MAKTQGTKVKKKNWYFIVAPKFLGEKIIGEAYLADPNLLMNRVISCNLMTITNDMRNQNITMKFIITEVKDNKGFTKPLGYELNQTFIKRMMRRRKNRIDESIHLKTADNRAVRIKLFLVTNNAIKSSILKRLRLKLKEEVKSIVSSSKYDYIFSDIITSKIQRRLRGIINKITPLKVCEVRVFKEEKERRKTIDSKEEKPESKKEEAIKEEKKEEANNQKKPKKEQPKEAKKEKPKKAIKKEDKDKEPKPKKKKEVKKSKKD